MSNVVPAYGAPRPVIRHQQRQLADIHWQGERAEAQVAEINRVAQRAMAETMLTGMVRREAEMMVPDQAQYFSMIAVAAGIGSVNVISSMYRY